MRFDGFVSSIHSVDLYKDVKFKLKDLNGVEYEEKGAYLIVDRGYHKWGGEGIVGGISGDWAKLATFSSKFLVIHLLLIGMHI